MADKTIGVVVAEARLRAPDNLALAKTRLHYASIAGNTSAAKLTVRQIQELEAFIAEEPQPR